ncbi:MAG TPA: formyltetrahydrofolate deformylase [Polyangiaceae bacterium]|jgi:formyltetrahydrofolate deformylase|nr:formyltetrahydrofolate deformylase [Polyangiaceae bacterium]
MSHPAEPIAAANLGTLLVSCTDRRGLVAALAQVLHGHGANILSADQHRDASAGQFFQRIQFDTSELLTDKNTLERAVREVQGRFDMQVRLSYADYIPKLALFVSRYDHCLYDLLWRRQSAELRCEIAAIVSNHDDLRPIADQFGVTYYHFPMNSESRAAQEARQLELLARLGIDLVVLARYMQILSPEFTQQYPNRIINIHHSFLPAFIGGKPYHQAHERGVKLIGATAHYATASLDEGPIIEQDVLRASHRDAIEDLVRKGRDVERAVLGRAVRWHIEQRVLVWGNKTVVFE